ncbi:MAG: lysoplasmalogenase [Aeromicrobium erythreum]
MVTEAWRSPWFRAFLVASALHLLLLGLDLSPWDSITKCFCAPLLAVWAWRAGAPHLLVDALVLCFFGDLFLELDGLFVVGMAAFAAAHVCFVTFFVRRGAREAVRRAPWAALLYLVLAVGMVVWAWTGLDVGLRAAVPVYALLLVATAATSLAVDRVAGLGGALFLVSDGIIALGEAGRIDSSDLLPRLAIMVLYLAGIAGLAIGATRVTRARADATPDPVRP